MNKLLAAIRAARGPAGKLNALFNELWGRVSLGAVLVFVILSLWVAVARQQVIREMEKDRAITKATLEEYRRSNVAVLEQLRQVQGVTEHYVLDNRAMFEYLRRIEEEPCPSQSRKR